MLYERSTIEQAIFTRGPIESDDNNAEIDASVFDLLTVFQKIVARHVDEVKMEIHREEISLADMIKNSKDAFSSSGEISILSFLRKCIQNASWSRLLSRCSRSSGPRASS